MNRIVLGVLLGSLYGIGFRLLFGSNFLPSAGSAGLIMTVGFLVLVPMAMGYLAIHFAERAGPVNTWQRLYLPWIPVAIGTVVGALLKLEGLICIVFALPITLISADIGGAIATFVVRRARKRSGTLTVCVAFLPLLIAPIEGRIDAPIQQRRVETQIAISATPERVWANIERVPRIDAAELPQTWTQLIGFPRPLEATLSFEGVGGVRHASFEHGLLFIETVDRWEPNHLLSFSIRADSEHIPKTTLDEHVTIGGKYFDVLNGKYEIEPLPSGGVLLHLSSEERVSTDFNGYAGLWSDAVMRNIQENILVVVKHRSERATE